MVSWVTFEVFFVLRAINLQVISKRNLSNYSQCGKKKKKKGPYHLQVLREETLFGRHDLKIRSPVWVSFSRGDICKSCGGFASAQL